MFRFGSPQMLYLLLLIPVMILLYIIVTRARAKRLEKFGGEVLLQLMPDASPKRIRNKFIIYLSALLLIIVGLARPQVGSKLKEVSATGVEIMFVVDVSNSMLAQDFEPNRLERTKYAINRMLDQVKQDKVGLIIFAGDAYVQLPITSDYVAARNFVRQISTTMVSKQGTAIGAAIDLASTSFSSDSEGSRVVILVSDGENHEDDAIAAANKAAQRGVTIHVVGVGTPEGTFISIGGEYMKDKEGNNVVTKLDETTLQELAVVTGGSYIRATNQTMGIDQIMDKVAETEDKEFTATIFEEFDEQYQYFIGAALLLLLIDGLMLGRKNHILTRFNIFSKSKPQVE